MSIVATALEVLLGLVFLGSGGSKIAGAKTQVESFARWRLPQWFRPIVGLVEITGALAMLVGVAVPWVAAAAGAWLGCVMLGALTTHVRIRDTAQHFAPPVVLLSVAAIVVALRWSSLVDHLS